MEVQLSVVVIGLIVGWQCVLFEIELDRVECWESELIIGGSIGYDDEKDGNWCLFVLNCLLVQGVMMFIVVYCGMIVIWDVLIFMVLLIDLVYMFCFDDQGVCVVGKCWCIVDWFDFVFGSVLIMIFIVVM